MLSQAKNDRLTRIGPETPMGALMRRYWIPALLSSQLEGPDAGPVRVKLLGEDLIAFRDSAGAVGLLEEHCPHRTASLFFGRNEDCGLRCVYHGWKFDVAGNVLDIPAERPDTPLKTQVKAVAYPTVERGGIIWAYMGPPELRPEFPDIEWTLLPDTHRCVSRRILECNWLQGFEGGFDSSHLSFLHKGDLSLAYPLPSQTEFVETDCGLVIAYAREIRGETLWSADTMLMPFHKLISMQTPGAIAWVPIDDLTTMVYTVDYSPLAPFTAEQLAVLTSGDLNHTRNAADERTFFNRDNDYGIDRKLQRSARSYSGIQGVGVQDGAMQESMGPIARREREHLGASDLSVVRLRRYLLEALDALEAGRSPPGLKREDYRVRPLFSYTGPDAAFADVMASHQEEVASTWAKANIPA